MYVVLLRLIAMCNLFGCIIIIYLINGTILGKKKLLNITFILLMTGTLSVYH